MNQGPPPRINPSDELQRSSNSSRSAPPAPAVKASSWPAAKPRPSPRCGAWPSASPAPAMSWIQPWLPLPRTRLSLCPLLAGPARGVPADGVVDRTVEQVVPPRLEYALTELGRELVPVLDGLHAWRGEEAASGLRNQSDHSPAGLRSSAPREFNLPRQPGFRVCVDGANRLPSFTKRAVAAGVPVVDGGEGDTEGGGQGSGAGKPEGRPVVLVSALAEGSETGTV